MTVTLAGMAGGRRADGRAVDALRPTVIEVGYVKAPPGSALIRTGDTWVLCTASVDESQPPFLRQQKSPNGWLSAEYSMLPGSTSTRANRASNGRSKEIERLIGRSLRAALNMQVLGPRTITIDCDVLQADGGTRTAAITGGFVALAMAIAELLRRGVLSQNPITQAIAAVSVGRIDGVACLDLPYEEDARAEVDMNLVMARPLLGGEPGFVEVQGTGEHGTFTQKELLSLSTLGAQGIETLFARQLAALGEQTLAILRNATALGEH